MSARRRSTSSTLWQGTLQRSEFLGMEYFYHCSTKGSTAGSTATTRTRTGFGSRVPLSSRSRRSLPGPVRPPGALAGVSRLVAWANGLRAILGVPGAGQRTRSARGRRSGPAACCQAGGRGELRPRLPTGLAEGGVGCTSGPHRRCHPRCRGVGRRRRGPPGRPGRRGAPQDLQHFRGLVRGDVAVDHRGHLPGD